MARIPNSSGSVKGCTDRISYLPESILGHILSFLPIKNAVATGILSQRWRFMWTTAINLEFCFGNPSYRLLADAEDKSRKFAQFVNYVLLLHKPGYLNKFSLIWENTCIPFYVTAWISVAVAKNVRELSVCVNNPVLMIPSRRRVIQVPSSMFSYEGLRSLELNFNFCISCEIVISLPKLESLKLISFYFDHDYKVAFSKLLGGCPVLNYLYIDMDIGNMLKYHRVDIANIDDDESVFECIVSSTSLRQFELYVHDEYDILGGRSICCVEFDTPSLEYIILKDKISRIFIQQSLSSLVESNIELLFPDYEQEQIYCNAVVEAVSGFECAKALTLSGDVMWALSNATNKLRTRFNRLTKLEVIIGCCYWSSLQDVMKLSDNLEVLAVKKESCCLDGDHSHKSNWKELDQVPSCLSNSLKTVSVGSYVGANDQLPMVGYILKHGNALKVVQICFGKSITDFELKFAMVKLISKFPRKSPVCELEFL